MANKNGVPDGARTRDKQNHNLLLYQLNYGHHMFFQFYRPYRGLVSTLDMGHFASQLETIAGHAVLNSTVLATFCMEVG